MNVLIVDSSKQKAYVECVKDDDANIVILGENEKHSENLLVKIDEVLSSSNLALKDIDVFGAVNGPGSFTGIRVGLSTIKAFMKVLNKKLVVVSAFEPFLSVVKNGVIILSNTRTTYYYAKVNNHKIMDMGLVDINDLDKFAKSNTLYTLDFMKSDILDVHSVEYISNYETLLKDAVLNKCGMQDYTKDTDFKPLYIQLSQAEANLKDKL